MLRWTKHERHFKNALRNWMKNSEFVLFEMNNQTKFDGHVNQLINGCKSINWPNCTPNCEQTSS